jgi:hypothetical protein
MRLCPALFPIPRRPRRRGHRDPTLREWVDGVFTEAADGSLRFLHPAPLPTDAEVGRLVATIRTRLLRLLRRRGVFAELSRRRLDLAHRAIVLAGAVKS